MLIKVHKILALLFSLFFRCIDSVYWRVAQSGRKNSRTFKGLSTNFSTPILVTFDQFMEYLMTEISGQVMEKWITFFKEV